MRVPLIIFKTAPSSPERVARSREDTCVSKKSSLRKKRDLGSDASDVRHIWSVSDTVLHAFPDSGKLSCTTCIWRPQIKAHWFRLLFYCLEFSLGCLVPIKSKVKVKSLSCVWLFVTPWTAAHQAPVSMGFSRQEYWSGLPFPSPGDLPNPRIEPRSLALQADALTSEPSGKPHQV